MAIAEKIQKYIEELPTPLQEEALDFVEYLLAKAKSKSKAIRQEEKEWSYLSLTSAMYGMEDEDMPIYTTDDLKVVFQ
ncbi:MAG: hypothetical protein QG641_1173 [Candidatus Poribacteria bacterium]|nr:hypothetical protein [Candidatus Poribacteria bacterium]